MLKVSIPATRVRYISQYQHQDPEVSCFNSRNAGKIHLPKIKSKQIFKIGFNSRGAGKIHLQKQRKHTVSMHLSLCKPPVLLLYYSTHVVFCLRSTQNLLGGTAFFCRGPARTPLLLQAKTGPKNRGTRKGAGRMLSKSVLQQPEALTPPVRLSPPPPAGGAPSQRGPRGKKRYFFIFFLTFPGTGPIAGV